MRDNRQIRDREYVIFSSHDLYAALQFLKEKKIGFKILDGCYRGQEEQSFIVNQDDFHDVYALAGVRSQESFLRLGPVDSRYGMRTAYLDVPGEPWGRLGYFTPCSEEEARAQDAWTCDDGQFYIVSENNGKRTKDIGDLS